jgi:hypothetical protein
MYRDDGDGTSSEVRAVNLWAYDETLLEQVRVTLTDLATAITSLESGTIYNGTTALTPKWAFANITAGSTDGAIVTAVALKKIRVVALAMVTGGTATTVTFNSKPGGAGAAISPLFANAANGGAVLPPNPWGWFQSAAGEGLTATTGTGATTGILVQYIEV